jgi:hypothetical protein
MPQYGQGLRTQRHVDPVAQQRASVEVEDELSERPAALG